jgi:hypothetical protein
MSYAAALRQRFEALAAGTAGTRGAIAAGRFRLRDAGVALEKHPANSAERAFEVVVDPGRDYVPVNPHDGFALRLHRVTFRVAYLLTHAGGDLAEVVGEQDGAGTLDAIRDRAETDHHDLVAVCSFSENLGGTDPAIVYAVPTDATTLAAVTDDVAILAIPLDVLVQATWPGAYAP